MRRGLGEFEEVEQPEEREVTLSGSLLALVGCGILVLCALCFWMGLSIGRHSAASASSHPAQAPAADNESVQSPSPNALSKPLAAGLAPAAQQIPAQPALSQSFGSEPPAAQNALTSYAPVSEGPAQPVQPRVKPALPGSSVVPSGQPAQPNSVQPQPASPATIMVQIAALSHVEDARVLMNALHQRGYNATATREPADGMIHVCIGPFATRAQASSMSQKLEGDGYNAQVQP